MFFGFFCLNFVLICDLVIKITHKLIQKVNCFDIENYKKNHYCFIMWLLHNKCTPTCCWFMMTLNRRINVNYCISCYITTTSEKRYFFRWLIFVIFISENNKERKKCFLITFGIAVFFVSQSSEILDANKSYT